MSDLLHLTHLPVMLPPLASRLAGVRSSPVRDLLQQASQPGVVSLAGGLPAPESFDVEGLAASFAAVLGGPQGARALQYATTEGEPELREVLAGLTTADGLPTRPEDLLVTTGSQQALTLVATALLEPGDAVLVEEPSYLAALQVFGLAGAVPVGVPGDDDGMDPEALTAAAAATGAKAVYLVPTFQNPTGRTMSAARRAAIAEACAAAGMWIVEDDPYSRLRIDGEPVGLIAAHPAAAERTVVVQTLSKVLAPGLRVGWLRAPGSLRPALTVAKQAADLHTPTVAQLAAAHWLTTHDMRARAADLREIYRPKRDTMLAELAGALPEGSRWTRPEGGLFVWIELPEGHDAASRLPAALEAGVAFVPGTPFFCGPPRPETLRVSYSSATVAELREAVPKLGRALAG